MKYCIARFNPETRSTEMTLLATLIVLPVVIGLYAYLGYPLLLKFVAASRNQSNPSTADFLGPLITITVPCYNE